MASDRFDPVAKTNFSLARHLKYPLSHQVKYYAVWTLDSQKIAVKTSELAPPKNIFSFKLPIHDFHVQNNLLGQLGRVPFDLKFQFEFPPGWTDLVLFPLEPISHQEVLDKMLKDRDEVAVLGAVSCFL